MATAMTSDNNLMHNYPSIYVNLLHSLCRTSIYIFHLCFVSFILANVILNLYVLFLSMFANMQDSWKEHVIYSYYQFSYQLL